MKFAKPSLTLSQQIDLLERRGMAIPDRPHAEHFLRHLSYYRLRAYWLPFETPCDAIGDHAFQAGTSFEGALQLYVFDRQLRLHVMDAIERLEVSFRAAWAYNLSIKYGPHGYIDPSLYNRADHYAKAFENLLSELERSTDTFMVHYKTKYGDPPQPPVWMAAEVMSLGLLSKWLSNLKLRADRSAISRQYGVDESILVSIMHHLTYIRNICAHHGRLWNKQFTVTMTIPNSPASLKIAMNSHEPRRIYNSLVAIGYLINIVAPGTDWCRKLVDLLEEHPLAHPSAMGFPVDWRGRPMWKKEVPS